ncbi:MAG: hydroxymethylbilane synthase [Balneolaceae bacterium]
MIVKIGTRNSTLAMWQAQQVSRKLLSQDIESELVEIESFGDKEQDLPIHKLGDKGVFTKALDDALLSREVDIAVHSLKDVPTVLIDGLRLAAVLKRGNPKDVLVKPRSEQEKNKLLTVATGSIRRTAFWKNRYPEDEVVGLRGNVPTRVQKVDSNPWHGAVFAYAGLERIGLKSRISEVLEWMIPAPSQGTVGIIARKDSEHLDLLKNIEHAETRTCVDIERAFLNELEAGCSSPVGAYAFIENETLHFKGAVLSVDGKERLDIERSVGLASAYPEKGNEWAKILKDDGAIELINRRYSDE